MHNIKRILLIIALVLLAILISLAIYFYIFKGTGFGLFPGGEQAVTTTVQKFPGAEIRVITTTTGTIVTPGSLPTAGVISQTAPANYYQPQAVSQLTSDYVIYPSLSQNGDLRYHNSLDGKFYRITADGQIKELNDKVFYNVSQVTWAKTSDKAVIGYPDNSKIVYDFAKNTQVSLPKHWEEFSFSPAGTEIAAKSLGLSPNNRWLITTKDDGTGTKTVEPMGNNADEVTIDWSPTKQVVAFSRTGRPIGAERQQILMVGLNNENFKALTVEGMGFESQWSPTGKKLLYSVYSSRTEYKPELWLVDAYGESINQNRQMLSLNTWSDKCAFGDDNNIYCAVPSTLPTGAGMARAIANSTPDYLYKIDLSSGLKTPITLDNNYTINEISYDAKNNKILFTDLNQTGVFEVKL